MNRRHALYLSALTALTGCRAAGTKAAAPETPGNHTGWVAQVLQRMQGVKPGMTRADLLKVFATEGGIATGLQRTYVSQECPFFKVNATFRAVGRPERDPKGRVTLDEDSRDLILSISRPYLEASVMD